MSQAGPDPLSPVVPSFSGRTIDLLRRAAHRLQNLDFDDEVGMFAAVRAAVTSLAPVDAFYIGLYRGDRGLVLPYTYYGDRPLRADFTHFREDGVSAWILRNRKTYRFATDEGRLLSRGMPLGDASKPSLDAVVIPIIHGDGDPIGLLSIQSETADVYTDEHVAAFEWLTRTLGRFLKRNQELAFDFDIFARYPELDPAGESTSLRTMHDVARRMSEIVDSAAALVNASRTTTLATPAHTEEHLALCERHQAELALVLGQFTSHDDDALSERWHELTSRQREVAELILQTGASNSEIAVTLSIRESTVKSHVRRILHVFGVADREAFRSLPGLAH
ncbi:GAF domain-containing protein [Flexivirga meconopsidis]|uniref:GAF domain-containing protein n=1 Tax=Flexivirga meconopsidis TaxID=2977121 RepID=UPI00223FC464|nr:GAF domain-containing protein [Flexivirga meconopsidis]